MWRRPDRGWIASAVILLVLVCAPVLGLSQTPTTQLPTDVPPVIAFKDWEQTDEFEFGAEYDASFPSPLVSGIPNNDTVYLKVLIPSDPAFAAPYPVVLILHYWGATDLRAEYSLASDLNARGIAAAIMTLPYHLERTPPGHRSGDLAVPATPEGIRQSTTQAVLDVRRSIDFLKSRSEFQTTRLGISGTSLGSLVAALAYGVDLRIDFGAFVLGGADFARIIWSSSRVTPQREVLRRAGYTEEMLRQYLKPVEPLTYLPRKVPGPTFVVGARYDTVVTPRSTEELIDALPGVKTMTLDTGHYGGIFVERKVLREVGAFFGDAFRDRQFVPPQRLYAPTIRFGLKIDTADGVDVGVGVDVVRFDPLGKNFLDFFLTPKGPQLILAHSLGNGFSAGGTFSSRGPGLGLFWSTVL
jgi:hypothetical protein